MVESESDLLIAAAAAIGIAVSAPQVTQLLGYLSLLEKWNRTYNLTAVRMRDQMLSRHIVESLSILPFLSGQRRLDVGTGAGLPGIPLAIVDPETRYTLLDSNGKKTRYLKQLVYDMGLNQVTVLDTRVEQWQPDQPFDVIVSRAFATLNKMVTLSEHLLSANGVWQAMKGEYPEEECNALPDSVSVESIERLQVPGLNEERHLVTIRKK